MVQRVLPPLTFSCVPVGEGSRIAIDRDGDGYADYDEIACGKDPANPNSQIKNSESFKRNLHLAYGKCKLICLPTANRYKLAS